MSEKTNCDPEICNCASVEKERLGLEILRALEFGRLRGGWQQHQVIDAWMNRPDPVGSATVTLSEASGSTGRSEAQKEHTNNPCFRSSQVGGP